MPLTDSAIRALKSRDKTYKVADEKGLYLQVTPSGGRSRACARSLTSPRQSSMSR
jgi:hypothetical protein